MLSNPRYMNAQHTLVDVDVETDVFGSITTTIDLNRPAEKHLHEIHDYLTENLHEIAPYVLPIESVKRSTRLMMELAARDAILYGFSSDALGSIHCYAGKETDQINLLGAATAGIDMLFPCADENGIWERRLHTAAQLQTVLAHGSAYKQAVLIALDQRRAEIDNANDLVTLNSIQWVEV